MLTITHTHEAGTLIDGTAKGDGTGPILKAAGWRWGRSIGTWYVPCSRDHLPKDHVIRRTVAALEAAGYEVAPVQLDKGARPMAEVEADKIARQADRVAALDAKAGRRAASAAAAWARHEQDIDRLPPGGEPVKVGHHSEGRHRAAIARADRSGRAAMDAHDDAAEAAGRAAAAADTTQHRYSPVTVANRIERIAADIRRQERFVAGEGDRVNPTLPPAQRGIRAEHVAPRLAEMRDQLAYWQRVRAEQIARGEATDYGPHTVRKGDAVRIGGSWRRVARANAKTVAVETGHSWTQKAPWHAVQAHRPAASATDVV